MNRRVLDFLDNNGVFSCAMDNCFIELNNFLTLLLEKLHCLSYFNKLIVETVESLKVSM